MIEQRKEKNMSTAEMTLLLQAAERKGACVSSDSALRIVLLQGEVLRVPPASGTLRVLSGTAWVSFEGRDVLLSRGERLDIARRADRPVVSGLGEPLLFEVC
jgi:hypothetical protein